MFLHIYTIRKKFINRHVWFVYANTLVIFTCAAFALLQFLLQAKHLLNLHFSSVDLIIDALKSALQCQ